MEENRDFQHYQTPEDQASARQPIELKFSVPWGHITAKAWGDPQGEPMLAVHGIDDNAATFDTLIPILLQLVGRPLYIVSVDLPGHGYSSPLPPGIPYRFTDIFGSLRRIVAQLSWHKFHFLGHSLGGLLGYYFAASYPELVQKLIVIDAIVFRMYPEHLQPNMLRAFGERLLKLEENILKGAKAPVYTLEQALHRMEDSRATKMTDVGVRALASRNLKPVEGHKNLYTFSRDPRVKFFNFPLFYDQEAIEIMNGVKCQVLVVIGNESQRTIKNSINEAVLNAVAKSCSYFKHHVVEGDHDVHLNFPERVAPHVAKFLCEPMSCL